MLFIQHPVDLSNSSGRNKVPTSPARPHQHVHDDWRCRHTLSSTALQDRHFLRRSLSAEKHTCLVLALQARQSPNTQDQAGRLKAATGHLFEVTSFTWYCGEIPRAKLQKVSSEDRRTTFRVQAVNQSTEMRSVLDFFATAQSICGGSLQSVQLNGAHSSHSSCWPWRTARVRTLQDKAESLMVRRVQRSMLSTTLWEKSPFEVAESVIGRPKDTSSWASSESECRVTVCVGVLRKSAIFP